MIVAVLNDDIVVGRGEGIVGPAIPAELLDLPDARLRFDGATVVDVGSEVQAFFIDAIGQKHIVAADGRQELACSVADRLQAVEGVWSVRTAADDLRAYAAATRWKREQAGTTWNSWPIHTDDRSQGKYLSELQAIAIGVRDDSDPWKFADGLFRPVTNAEFPALATAAREHVRTVFGIEGAVLAAITSEAITTREQIDAAFAA